MNADAMHAGPALAPGTDVHCSIEKLVFGGQGLARIASRVVFIDGVLPGEEVHARIVATRKQCYFAYPLAIIRPSPYRASPPCPLFDECGGCHWQHIDYEFQIQLKTAAVRECFSRIAKMPDAPVFPILPSPLPLAYRTRARLQIIPSRPGSIGFYRRRSRDVIDVPRCPVCADPVNAAIDGCRSQLRNHPALFGAAQEIDILCSVRSGAALVSAAGRSGRPVSYLCTPAVSAWEASPAPLRDAVGGLVFIRAPGSFYQGNTVQNEHMIACVAGVFDSRRHQRVLDVYSGCGNFSLFLARAGIDVTGIEAHAPSVREARANARCNGLKNCAFHTDRAENLSRYCKGATFDGVLLNPPRAGCGAGVIRSVCALRPRTIACVSCNPSTLARDVALLTTGGYRLKTVQPFDMFPHTYHIECIAVMDRA